MVWRLGIVENDSLLRSALHRLASDRGDIEVVSSDARGESILEQAARGNLDVALLDVHLGDGPTGFDVAVSLRQLLPAVGIVFLTSVKDPRLLGRQTSDLPRGARYLLKSEISDTNWLFDHIVASVGDSQKTSEHTPPSIPLSHTQIEILRLVAGGYSNADIAKMRFVTEGAVEVAMSRLVNHLGLRDTPHANRRVHVATTFFREMGWGP